MGKLRARPDGTANPELQTANRKLAALRTAQAGAASILEAGGVATPEGWRLFQQLDRDLIALKSSPRGSADMLAATIFIDDVSKRPVTQND